jgi:hypothetical protein
MKASLTLSLRSSQFTTLAVWWLNPIGESFNQRKKPSATVTTPVTNALSLKDRENRGNHEVSRRAGVRRIRFGLEEPDIRASAFLSERAIFMLVYKRWKTRDRAPREIPFYFA